jgi:hypothetical protein
MIVAARRERELEALLQGGAAGTLVPDIGGGEARLLAALDGGAMRSGRALLPACAAGRGACCGW